MRRARDPARPARRSTGMGVLWLVLCLGGAFPAPAAPAVAVSRGSFHLRSGDTFEWDEFKHQTPAGAGLTVSFPGPSNPGEATLLIRQDNVKLDWTVQVNGQKVGTLFLMEAPLLHALAVPAGLLRDGLNTLSLLPPRANDDIIVGPISLELRPLPEVLSQATLQVKVSEHPSGAPLPCRLTLVDEGGNLAALSAGPATTVAARPGVVYTANGQASIGLPPGKYKLYATRGIEYGLGTADVSVAPGETSRVALQLRREVPTPGWIASDTHIHTGTYARHGDATVEERAITLAGEGIELPVSTEHDCLVDYSGAALRTGVLNWFTPVIGDEVTTAQGHFNVFPVSFSATLPDRRITDWPKLMEQFRGTPGVQVVVLNHPRNIHTGFQPFAATHFNAVTGENLRGFEFGFDAIEVANSSALQSDWMISFHDWFALLNYGYRFTALGSSDGHDVSRYIVGQGRTYIACPDTDPGRIDVGAACQSVKQGRALVSLGLLANMTVDGRFGVGDLATGLGERIHVRVEVLGPSWVRADRVELFANGVRIRDEKIQPRRDPEGSSRDEPLDVEISWELPRPDHDVHWVALASGPGVLAPYWSLARPYQPNSPTWDPRVVGATNPIWIDGDDDGLFTSARGYARRLVKDHAGNAAGLSAALQRYDRAVAAQAASLKN